MCIRDSVYTPFHGTGLVPVKRVLSELGFKNVYIVPEQELPDPEFTTLEYPNQMCIRDSPLCFRAPAS